MPDSPPAHGPGRAGRGNACGRSRGDETPPQGLGQHVKGPDRPSRRRIGPAGAVADKPGPSWVGALLSATGSEASVVRAPNAGTVLTPLVVAARCLAGCGSVSEWDLVSSWGISSPDGTWIAAVFDDSVFHIALPDSGRSQTLRGPGVRGRGAEVGGKVDLVHSERGKPAGGRGPRRILIPASVAARGSISIRSFVALLRTSSSGSLSNLTI